MPKLTPFDFHFLERYPNAAADTLVQFSATDVAETLSGSLTDESKSAICATLAELEPKFAAECIAAMPVAASTQLLAGLDDVTATAMLRGSEESTRKTIFSGLPESRALLLDRRLKFAAGSVGAIMEPTNPTFGVATLVSTCLARIRSSKHLAQTLIVSTKSSGKFAGAITLSRLVAADDKTKLGSLIDPTIRPLHQNMLLESAAENPSWQHQLTLPVVDADNDVVGELTYDGLKQALSGADAMETLVPPASILANLGHAYLLSLRGFAGLGESTPHRSGVKNNG